VQMLYYIGMLKELKKKRKN